LGPLHSHIGSPFAHWHNFVLAFLMDSTLEKKPVRNRIQHQLHLALAIASLTRYLSVVRCYWGKMEVMMRPYYSEQFLDGGRFGRWRHPCSILLRNILAAWSKLFSALYLSAVIGLLSLTGHLGGAMTHGEDYFF